MTRRMEKTLEVRIMIGDWPSDHCRGGTPSFYVGMTERKGGDICQARQFTNIIHNAPRVVYVLDFIIIFT